MLLLTRKVGEMINIGDNITVRVMSIGRNQVVIGLEAPIEVKIWRNELVDNKKKQPKYKNSEFPKKASSQIA